MFGSTRINILDSKQEAHQVSIDTRNSKRKIKYNYEIYIEHLKLKTFLNRLIPTQGYALFNFAIKNLQKKNNGYWNMEVLLEFRA